LMKCWKVSQFVYLFLKNGFVSWFCTYMVSVMITRE
jgi:hypothetical protein